MSRSRLSRRALESLAIMLGGQPVASAAMGVGARRAGLVCTGLGQERTGVERQIRPALSAKAGETRASANLYAFHQMGWLVGIEEASRCYGSQLFCLR